jgi:hypothetical protein
MRYRNRLETFPARVIEPTFLAKLNEKLRAKGKPEHAEAPVDHYWNDSIDHPVWTAIKNGTYEAPVGWRLIQIVKSTDYSFSLLFEQEIVEGPYR